MNKRSIRHVMCPIPQFPASFALFSGASPRRIKRAVVFVHGFNGSAHSTWTDFVGLIDTDSITSGWWNTVDLYFFDYHKQSVFEQVARNTVTLAEFIEFIWPVPSESLTALFEEVLRIDFSYEEITLVGHSEGGLLVRKVILEAARYDIRLENYRLLHDRRGSLEPQPEGILKADLRLFAPAIAGEAISGILGILGSLPIVSNFVRGSSAKQSLASESVSVSAARKATEEYTEYLTMNCFRAHILWADHDSVVFANLTRGIVFVENLHWTPVTSASASRARNISSQSHL